MGRLLWLLAAKRYSGKVGQYERSVYQDLFGVSRAQMQRDISALDDLSGEIGELPSLSSYLKDILGPEGRFRHIETPRRASPSDHTIMNLISAIRSGTVLTCRYISVTSGASYREIVPSMIVDVCGRLHVRAYDVKKTRHADFVLSRMSGANDTGRKMSGKIPEDEEMKREISVQITPSQSLPDDLKKAIEADYGMTEGVRITNIPEAFRIYLPEIYGFDVDGGQGVLRPVEICIFDPTSKNISK